MIHKLLFFILFMSTFSYATFQSVKIGKIDKHYASSLTKNELRIIIDSIEKQLESQLKMNIFDYSKHGKPIDIVYVAPKLLEKRIERKIKLLRRKKEKLNSLVKYFPLKQKEILIIKKSLEEKFVKVNKKTKLFNAYVRKVNKHKDLSKDEYLEVKAYVNKEQKLLKSIRSSVKKEQRKFQKIVSRYNNKIFSYNNKIRDYNFLSNEITRLSRSVKKVKGKTFGFEKISLKTFYKNGKKIREKSVKKAMNKIEIYGFETKAQLKAVLAHEIGHLVGIPHINVKNALMNPILQENQIKKLFLIKADIRNFKRNF